MTERGTKETIFYMHRGPILMAAGVLNAAAKAGTDPDPRASRINILPRNLGDLSPKELDAAQIAEAQVNVAARVVTRIALLEDAAMQGGPAGLLARVEIGLTRVLDSPYLQDAFNPGGIIDTLRRIRPPTN